MDKIGRMRELALEVAERNANREACDSLDLATCVIALCDAVTDARKAGGVRRVTGSAVVSQSRGEPRSMTPDFSEAEALLPGVPPEVARKACAVAGAIALEMYAANHPHASGPPFAEVLESSRDNVRSLAAALREWGEQHRPQTDATPAS